MHRLLSVGQRLLRAIGRLASSGAKGSPRLSVDVERTAAEQAQGVAHELLRIARLGGTEADFRREASRVLEEAGALAGLTIVPRDEFSVARGRVDSVYNRLIIEYKRPGVIHESIQRRANQEVIRQVKDYIL